MTVPVHEKPAGVSSIELFFDLVFVFVITQVTQLVEHANGAMDFLRALLVLVPNALGSASRARCDRRARDRRHRDRAAAGIPQGLTVFFPSDPSVALDLLHSPSA